MFTSISDASISLFRFRYDIDTILTIIAILHYIHSESKNCAIPWQPVRASVFVVIGIVAKLDE